MAYSYTLSGTSKYIQRLTGVHSPIIKRPIHNLADGTTLALIFDENDSTAKYGTKNNVAKALLYQSNADRTTWTLRASYTIPSGTFPTGTATIHGGACLMNDESLYFVWRGVPDSDAPGFEVRGAVFSKTGANTWANPTSNELLFSPTTRFPYRFDLDRNTVTNHIFIGWMYRDDYTAAGIRLTPTQPDLSFAARSTVIQSLFYAVLMIPVSMWPTWLGVTGRVYEVVAAILSLGYLWYTVRFARIVQSPGALQSRTYARDLLKASVIYLPLLMAALMLDAKGRLLF